MYNDALAKAICDLVAQRVPVYEICKMDGMPEVGTLYRWKRENQDFCAKYACAREHRADARQDFVDGIVADVKGGSLDPAAARVIIEAERWQMGKEKPKSYGDRVTTEVSGPDGAPLVPEGTGTRDLARAILGILKDAKVEGGEE